MIVKIFALFSFVVVVASDRSVSLCPSEELIVPCKCCEETHFKITCSGLQNRSMDESVIQIALQNLATYHLMQKISPVVDALELTYTMIREVRREMFGGLAFKEIWFKDNFYLCLDHLSRDAFLDSKESLRVFKATIEFHGEATKEHNHDGSVLERFQGFKEIEIIDFMNYHMKVIPGHYYCKYSLPKLRQIWMNVNGIERIEDNAFHKLNLTMLALMSNNINRISKFTFSFEIPSTEPLIINMWLNNLTERSFDDGSFANTQRPVKLDISYNKLVTLPEKVFKDVVANENGLLSVEGNPLVCDCHLRWLFDEDYVERVKGLACISSAKSIRLLRADDLGKCGDGSTGTRNVVLHVLCLVPIALLFSYNSILQ